MHNNICTWQEQLHSGAISFNIFSLSCVFYSMCYSMYVTSAWGTLHRNLKCFAPGSVWSQIYTDSCTRISKNFNVHSFVNQNHYEYRCTQRCVLGSVRTVTYMVLCSRISMQTNAHYFAPESIWIQMYTELCMGINKSINIHRVVCQN